jgi:hypothetical protein
MTDLQLLYVALVALYLAECFAWSNSGSVWWHAPWGSRWLPATPVAESQRGRLVLANPLPPLGLLAHSKLSPLDAESASAIDLDATAARLSELHRYVSDRRLLGSGRCLLVFLGFPFLIERFGYAMPTRVGVAVVLLLCWTTTLIFFRGHRRLCPDGRGYRVQHSIMMGLAPTAAMRAADSLARTAFEDQAPLAVLLALSDDESRPRRAAKFLRELSYPLADETEAGRAQYLEAVNAILQSVGLEPSDLMQPPPRVDPHARAYCPRCLDEFLRAEASCSTCRGMELHSFE